MSLEEPGCRRDFAFHLGHHLLDWFRVRQRLRRLEGHLRHLWGHLLLLLLRHEAIGDLLHLHGGLLVMVIHAEHLLLLELYLNLLLHQRLLVLQVLTNLLVHLPLSLLLKILLVHHNLSLIHI